MDLRQRRQNVLNFIVLFIAFLSLFHYSDADCNITTSGVHTFGPECQYMCHCTNGESCDTTTGECTSGCDRYWFGPGCQYADLAENEFSRHASNTDPPYWSYNGNDGDTSTCSYTQVATLSTKIPWWRVVLENEVNITDIYILTSDDGLQYFPNFEVTVEKLSYSDRLSHTKPSGTSVCYRHDDTVPDSTSIYVTCTEPLIGNQVRITLSEKKSQLILCDFRINQGRNIAFGQSVTSSTIYNNDSQYQASYAVDGLVSSNSPCFMTGNFRNKSLQVEMDQLMDVHYFNICKYSDDYIKNYTIYDTSVMELLYDSGSDQPPATHGYLNRNLQKIKIEKISGNVMAICELKLFGDCPTHQCGYDCSTICHCKTMKSLEDKISGICTSGCEERWTGVNGKCDTECSNVKWGTSCQNDCGACRQGTCDVVSGKCTGDCQDGYYNTDNCTTECNNKTYGYKCQSNCSDNCHNSCNKINGTCIGGCKPGYMGDKCERECNNGTYGYKCQSNCSDNCQNSCNKVNGTCIGGCKSGYMGHKCEQECFNGTYGHNCESNCSDNCQNSCNIIHGKCIDGCKPGYMGDKCEQECDAGTFGQKCQNQCNENCNDTCHHVSGNCTSCKAGWTGNVCDTECANGTYGIKCGNNCTGKCLNVCDKINGFCSSCTPGWIGNFCENECANRTYGLNCNESCNSNCEDVCDHVTGECTQCKSGWKNDFCDKECDNGTFGVNCSENCTSKCLNVCDKQTGDCLECQNGWTGNICQTECTNGTYGSNCKQNCSTKCTDICERVDGSCNCMTGWHGDTCLNECEDGSYGDYCKEQCGYCYNNTACDTINGTCTLGCDSGYEGSLCTSKIVTEPPRESLPVEAIAGASSTFVVVVIIVVVAFIVIRRRLGFKNNANTESIDGKEVEWKNVSHNSEKNESDNLRSTHRIKQDGSIYENSFGLSPKPDISEDEQPMASSTLTNPPSNAKIDANEYYVFGSDPDCKKTARVITLNEITQYVKSKLATVDFFDREFQDIPYGLQHPTLDARKPGNIGKNRYKELYAYDHSRVVLKTLPSEPNSDYINASYIKGYKKDRAYIASQGPTVKNKNEFWRMIWENKINLIAMVTKLIEETKNKCIQYWAENGKGKTFGKVTVFTESEEEFAEYSIRRLKITYDGEKENRYVLHYIYTAWPDKNIPNSTCSLLHFWQKVRKNDANKANPWLVHCSAGIGRTGTFIAIDYLYDQGRDAGYIDINACVRQLRDQRVNMVQMKEQYRYLYRMMIEALVLPSTPVLLHTFNSYYAELLTEDEKSRQPKLKLEFEVMSQTDCLVKDSETQEYAYKDAKHADNKVKNRYSNILAPDEYRPFMSTQVPGTTNYINAMYMPSYSDLFGYIISQTPLPDTAVDCCRLIIDQDINVVVTFEDNGDNEVGIYLPREGFIQVGPFDVTLNEEEMKDGYLIRRHKLKFKSKDHAVIQVVCQNWSAGELVPTDPSQMVQILQDISELQRENDNKPVMLQCLNGAERSGLFVVLMNIIERSTIEEEVSILEVVRYLRSRRQQIVPNYEQYKFCHDVLSAYIESNSTYANL